MSQGSPDDRRIDTRVDKINLVQVSRFDEEGFRADLATGRTLNISRGGLRLELHHPLPLRSVVSLDLLLAERLVQIEGVVVYLEALNDDTCCMGVEFRNVPPDIQGELNRLVDAYEASLDENEETRA